MVIGNFRLCVRNPGKKCGFSNIGKTDKTYVGNNLQFQQNFKLCAGCPGWAYFGTCMAAVA